MYRWIVLMNQMFTNTKYTDLQWISLSRSKVYKWMIVRNYYSNYCNKLLFIRNKKCYSNSESKWQAFKSRLNGKSTFRLRSLHLKNLRTPFRTSLRSSSEYPSELQTSEESTSEVSTSEVFQLLEILTSLQSSDLFFRLRLQILNFSLSLLKQLKSS